MNGYGDEHKLKLFAQFMENLEIATYMARDNYGNKKSVLWAYIFKADKHSSYQYNKWWHQTEYSAGNVNDDIYLAL